MLLEGKTVVVTGSSKGLGRAFALGLAKEGASVLVNGMAAGDVAQVVEEIKKAGGKAVGCVESVGTMAGAERIIQSAIDAFGHLDVLVNNAGVIRDRTFLKMSEEEWDTVIQVHLKGTFACSKFAALHMSQRQSGTIINITSGASWDPAVGQSNYAAAKGGITSFSYVLALELARYNINVNAVWPLAVTRMTLPSLDKVVLAAKEAALKANAPVPSARDLGYGEPEMVAPLVVYLASDEAKDVTGKIVALHADKLFMFSRNEEVASAIMPGGWTVEEARNRFKRIFSKYL